MGKKKYRCVPLELMRKVEGEYPEAWDQMVYFHSLRGSEPDMQWPEWCYSPMAAASAIVTNSPVPDFSEKAFFVLQILGKSVQQTVPEGHMMSI